MAGDGLVPSYIVRPAGVNIAENSGSQGHSHPIERGGKAYAKLLKETVRRCGRVYDRDKVMTLFTEGLHPGTRTLSQPYRSDQHRATYLELI